RRGLDGAVVQRRRSCGPRKLDIAAASGPKGSPRVDVVFRLWQCDKENHGWREGPPVTVLCQSFRSAGRTFTLRLNQFRTKTRILLYVVGRLPPQSIGRFKTTIRPSGLRHSWAFMDPPISVFDDKHS